MYSTINQSDAGATTRTVATRAASKKSARVKKVTSSFGADLSKVYSFDGPDDAQKGTGTSLREEFSNLA